jgi:hypothetical protein
MDYEFANIDSNKSILISFLGNMYLTYTHMVIKVCHIEKTAFM